MLELKNVSAAYGKIQALFGVSLEVKDGEIVTLIGANGAGKTTTIKAISGLIRPTEGEILYGGKSLNRMSPSQIVEMGLVHVPEGRRIFSGLTVFENLEMGAVTRKCGRKETLKDMDRVFELFPRLKERIKQRGWSLSGGEQQMLAIGRAMMAKPRLIMFDEPSLGLSPLLVDAVLESIARLNREMGVTVLLVEQNAFMALNISNRAYVLETGIVKIADDSRLLMDDPAIKKAYFGLSD